MSTSSQPVLSVGRALETNFIIQKFLALPNALQRLIYEALHCEVKSVVYAAGGFALLELATEAKEEELTAFINSQLGSSFTGWLIWPEDRPRKAALIARHFAENLKFEDEQFAISSVILAPMPEK